MDEAVNEADGAFRDTIPVALRVSTKVIFTTAAAQAGAEIAACPLVCLSTTNANTSGLAVCATNSDCSAYAGNQCKMTNGLKKCVNTGYVDKICASNADCGGVASSCTGSTASLRVCDGGADDGELCQTEDTLGLDCVDYGNCCSLGDDYCVHPTARARRSAGRYRIAPAACVGGASTGYLCSTNGDCAVPGTCTGLPAINTQNSGAVHLFTGCKPFIPGAGSPELCSTTAGPGGDQDSCSVTAHNTPGATALDNFGTFCHEVGHTLGAGHDNGGGCEIAGLAIQQNVCDSGPRVNIMCDQDANGHTECTKGCTGGTVPGASCSTNSDCTGGGTCTSASSAQCDKLNERNCIGSGDICISNSDCGTNADCDGPVNRLCVGGANDGDTCNASYSWMCPSGTCTGAPMNWELYAMGGSGALGYSPCSQSEIGDYVATDPTCLHNLVCGDVDQRGGSHCISGTEINSACTSNGDCSGSGTCQKVCSGGTSRGWPCTSNTDCADSGTCTYVNAITTGDALGALILACSGDYDDLADVYPKPPEVVGGVPDGIVDDCAGTSGDTDYLLDVAVGLKAHPTVCGVDDEPWW